MKIINRHWQDIVRASVSPLGDGIAPLQLLRLRPDSQTTIRPSRTAAVLVGILDRDRPEIVLTQRALHLGNHPGQVSFPGGAAEGLDETAVATALREAEEEIGLAASDVKPLGFLDRLDTISDFRVLPVVGLLSHSGAWSPDRSEVEEVFTVPLEMATDVLAYEKQYIERNGERHLIYSMEWQGRTIWGITAAILVNLAQRMERANTAATG